MRDHLDEKISAAFKKLDQIKSDLYELTLLLGHIEETAKKKRDKVVSLEEKGISDRSDHYDKTQTWEELDRFDNTYKES